MTPTRPFLMSKPNVYAAIIEEIFESKFKNGMKIDGDVKLLMERHYRLVEPGELTAEDLAAYRKRTVFG